MKAIIALIITFAVAIGLAGCKGQGDAAEISDVLAASTVSEPSAASFSDSSETASAAESTAEQETTATSETATTTSRVSGGQSQSGGGQTTATAPPATSTAPPVASQPPATSQSPVTSSTPTAPSAPPTYTEADYQDIINQVRAYAESRTKVKFVWTPSMKMDDTVGYHGTPDLTKSGKDKVISTLKYHVDLTVDICTNPAYGMTTDTAAYNIVYYLHDGHLIFTLIYG